MTLRKGSRRSYKLEEYSFHFKSIKEGCIQFICNILKTILSYLFEFKVTGSIMADFAACNIVSLQINDMMLLHVNALPNASDLVSCVYRSRHPVLNKCCVYVHKSATIKDLMCHFQYFTSMGRQGV